MLEIKNLTVEFETVGERVRAVNDVSLAIGPGEVIGLVGESGSGKTTLGLALTRLIPEPPARIPSGSIVFEGQDLLRLKQDELTRVRGGRIAYIFQEPSTSLNPVMTIGSQLIEAIECHTPLAARSAARGTSSPAGIVPARSRAIEWLGRVGIPSPEDRLDSFPHELSGGMKQRVMIAMAVACSPTLLVADEPTTALDVTLERQIVALLLRLRKELGLSVLIISHNIHLVRQVADRIAVMWEGRIVEQGKTAQVLAAPAHDYTKRLLSAQPKIAALDDH